MAEHNSSGSFNREVNITGHVDIDDKDAKKKLGELNEAIDEINNKTIKPNVDNKALQNGAKNILSTTKAIEQAAKNQVQTLNAAGKSAAEISEQLKKSIKYLQEYNTKAKSITTKKAANELKSSSGRDLFSNRMFVRGHLDKLSDTDKAEYELSQLLTNKLDDIINGAVKKAAKKPAATSSKPKVNNVTASFPIANDDVLKKAIDSFVSELQELAQDTATSSQDITARIKEIATMLNNTYKALGVNAYYTDEGERSISKLYHGGKKKEDRVNTLINDLQYASGLGVSGIKNFISKSNNVPTQKNSIDNVSQNVVKELAELSEAIENAATRIKKQYDAEQNYSETQVTPKIVSANDMKAIGNTFLKLDQELKSIEKTDEQYSLAFAKRTKAMLDFYETFYHFSNDEINRMAYENAEKFTKQQEIFDKIQNTYFSQDSRFDKFVKNIKDKTTTLSVATVEDILSTIGDAYYSKQSKDSTAGLDDVIGKLENILLNLVGGDKTKQSQIIADINNEDKDFDEIVTDVYEIFGRLNGALTTSKQIINDFDMASREYGNLEKENNSARENAIKAAKENALQLQAQEKARTVELTRQKKLIVEFGDNLTELEKKAQTMTWKNFTLDETLTPLKSQAGLNTLADIESFWTKANYNKKLNYYQMQETEAKQFIESIVPSDLFDWYEKQDFDAKTQLEKLVLEDNELRNAAINNMYYTLIKFAGYNKTFYEFLDDELEVFRGDENFAIFNDVQSLSFSYLKSHALKFTKDNKKNPHEENVASTKIKPINTIGNLATPRFEDEAELFVPSDKLPYKYNLQTTFEEFYNSLEANVKKALDDELVYLEKKRIKNLLGESVTKVADRITSEDNAQISKEIIGQFNTGKIPEHIEKLSDGILEIDTNAFIDMYNNLSAIEKKIIAFYTTLPDTTGMDENWAYLEKLGGKTGVTPAMFTDKEGYSKHIDTLTNRLQFNFDNDFIDTQNNLLVENISLIEEQAEKQEKLNDAEKAYLKLKVDESKITDRKTEFPSGEQQEFVEGLAREYSAIVDILNEKEQEITNVLRAGLVYRANNILDTLHDAIKQNDGKLETTLGRDYFVSSRYTDKLIDHKWQSQNLGKPSQELLNEITTSNVTEQFKLVETQIARIRQQEEKELTEAAKRIETESTNIRNFYLNANDETRKLLDELALYSEKVRELKAQGFDSDNSQEYLNVVNRRNSIEETLNDKYDFEFTTYSNLISVIKQLQTTEQAITNEKQEQINAQQQLIAAEQEAVKVQEESITTQQTRTQTTTAQPALPLNEKAQTASGATAAAINPEIISESNAKTEAEISKIKQAYSELLNVIQKINSINAEIFSMQKAGKTGAPYESYLAGLKNTRANLQNQLIDIQSKVSASSDTFKQGNMFFELPDVRSLNVDKSVILNFLNDVATQSELTQAQMDKLVETFNQAGKFDMSVAIDVASVLAPFDEINQRLANAFGGETQVKFTENLQNLAAKIAPLREQFAKGNISWDSQEMAMLKGLIAQYEKYGNALATAAEKENAYFKNKIKLTADSTLESVIGASSTVSRQKPQAQKILEAKAKELAGDRVLLTSDFKTTANGISQLDFTVFDKGTNSLKNFKLELGSVTEQLGITETTVDKTAKTISNAQSQISKYSDMVNLLGHSEISVDPTNTSAQVKRMVEDYQLLTEEMNKVGGGDTNKIAFLTNNLKASTKEVERLYNGMRKLNNEIEDNPNKYQDLGIASLNQSLEAQLKEKVMSDYVSTFQNAEVKFGQFDSASGRMTVTINELGKGITKATATVDPLTGKMNVLKTSMVEAKQATTSSISVYDKFKSTLGNIGKQLLTATIGYNVFYKAISMFRNGIGYVKDIDLAMTELKKVTDNTAETYDKFIEHAYDAAGKVGATVSEFTEATANFARLGYNINEASDMAETAIVYKNVADGIDDINVATESIISTMKAFGVEANNTMSIADKFNEVNFLPPCIVIYLTKDGYIGKTLETDNSEERFNNV